MQVVILAGVLGTRISEESQFRPKPMIEIGGMPILWHIMKHYAEYGYNEFIILRDYLLSNEKEVMDYCNCKKGIIELENIDRNMYKEIKSKYVSDLIERAKKYYNIK